MRFLIPRAQPGEPGRDDVFGEPVLPVADRADRVHRVGHARTKKLNLYVFLDRGKSNGIDRHLAKILGRSSSFVHVRYMLGVLRAHVGGL